MGLLALVVDGSEDTTVIEHTILNNEPGEQKPFTDELAGRDMGIITYRAMLDGTPRYRDYTGTTTPQIIILIMTIKISSKG